MTLQLQQAVSLHGSGELRQASEIYQDVLRQDPRHFDALQLLGLVYAQVQQWEKALALFDLALQVNAKSPNVLNNQGIVLKALKRFKDAEVSFRAALEIKHDYPEAYNNLGIALQEQGREVEALAKYEAAISLNANYAQAYSNRGNALSRMHRYDEAVASCIKAIELQSNNPEAYFNKGVAQKGLNQWQEALSSYDKATELNASFAQAYFNKAIIFNERKQFEKAIFNYKKAIEASPSYSQAHYNLGLIFTEMKDWQSALFSFGKALEFKKEFPEAYLNCGNIFKELKQFDEAALSYSRAIETRPDYSEAYGNRGSVRHEAGFIKEAIDDYKKALALNPALSKVRFLLAALGVGGVPEAMPAESVVELFDNYASKFDADLTELLAYQAPQILFNQYRKFQTAQIPSLLDLGCGTGLCGEAFKGVAQWVVGVDLSEKMLDQARAKAIYSQLICADILTHVSNEMESYDLIVGADVLIYMGPLDALFGQLKKVLRTGGYFGFTVESCMSSNFELKTTQRYGHSKSYIHALASSNGFSVVDVQDIKLRKEKGEDIFGSAVLLQSTGAHDTLHGAPPPI